MSKDHTLEMEPFQGNSRYKASKWDKIFNDLRKATQEEPVGLADSNDKNEIDLKILKAHFKEGTSFEVSLPFVIYFEFHLNNKQISIA